MNIKEALKQVNKGLEGRDRYSVVSELPKEDFDTNTISTGSPYLDYKIRDNELGGGLPKGRFTLIVGGEGSGKSSLTCISAAAMQKKEGKFLVYMDAEGTIDNSHFDRFGVDRELTIHRPTKNLEEMLDSIEVFSKSDDVGMIVIDSIPMFVSTVTEEKTASENSMAVEARKYNARMGIIYGNCRRRGIALVGINFYRMNPGAMGDPRILVRGEWQKQFSSLTLDLTKKDLILDKNKDVIGHELHVRIKKSKLQSVSGKEVVSLNFYHQYGFNVVDDFVGIFIEKGLVEQSGSWFSFSNSDGEEIKYQGKPKVVEYLKENKVDLDFLTSLSISNENKN